MCAVLQPVCTTEIGRLALKYKELLAKGVKIATLSADAVSHTAPTPSPTCLVLDASLCASRREIEYACMERRSHGDIQEVLHAGGLPQQVAK